MSSSVSSENSRFNQSGHRIVDNAGLVLLNHHILMLFEMCGYLSQRKFKDTAMAHRAVHLLQFLATGEVGTGDEQLIFNKLLCGLSTTQPVDTGITLLDTEKELCLKLLRNVIVQWPILNNTSVAGLREAFICRKGKLDENAVDKVTLSINPERFDMLLLKLPWTYSTICLPWMPRTLHTHWR